LVAIPAAIITGLAGKAERDKASESTVQHDRDVYNQRADTLFYVSAGTAAVAMGVYVFNLLNAYAAAPDYGLGETKAAEARPKSARVVLSDKIGLSFTF